MCLALPLKLIKIEGNKGIGEMNGYKKNIRLDLLPNAKLGDYVMVHAGFAIEILKKENALKDIEAIMEVSSALNEDN